jgi:class 3 adenylate cyclase/predicted ATPase
MPELTGERRHLTVLFCDLVGSTEIASHLDPEEWREIVGQYHHAAAQAIERFGGRVAQYLGDGVMAYFGWPEAHDNDAERAARAGLAILEAIGQLNESSEDLKLAVRIGIDSGHVVVGSGLGQAVDAFGDAANVAARVQACAEPDTVLVTGKTHRLISGMFVVEDRGPQTLKGLERPVRLFRVVRPSGVRGRFEAAAAAGELTRFVGREDELRSLLSRWERAREGEGQVLTIIGEVGIGKSRLVRRFHEQIAATPHTWLEASAGAFFQNTPFYPIAELLQQLIGRGTVQERIAALAARLTAIGLNPEEVIPLLAPLLNLSLPPEYSASQIPRKRQRRRLLATLVDWVLGSARAQPLVSVIEDLHWADPSTMELIQLLVEQGANAPLLLLYTARPECRVPWALRAHHSQVALDRLSVREVRSMVNDVLGRQPLSDEAIATVIERSGGVPLFVEELTRALVDGGGAVLPGNTVPDTLIALLMARLDRLGPAREVAHIGAVIGNEFSYELLHSVHQVPETRLQAALRELADAELIYVRGIAPDATYQFKHALIRDVAYEALLKSRRRELHKRVALTIDENFPDLKTAHPEVLARHWTQAGELDRAITQWSAAGTAAEARNAFQEALDSYRVALTLLDQMPGTAERDRRELALQVRSGIAIIATRGWWVAEFGKAYVRAQQLCASVGDDALLSSVVFGLWSYHLVRGELPKSREYTDEVMRLSARLSDDGLTVQAQWMSGVTHFFMGQLAAARRAFGESIDRYNPASHRSLVARFAQDPCMSSLCFDGIALWLLGLPEQAQARIQQALTLARALDHPFSLAWCLSHFALYHTMRRDYAGASATIAEAIPLCIENDIRFYEQMNRTYGGIALALQGKFGELKAIQPPTSTSRESDSVLSETYMSSALAEAFAKRGKLDRAEALLARASTCLDRNQERYVEPEIERIRGQLVLRRAESALTDKESSYEAAEHAFRRAMEIADEAGTKSLQLRAAISLARLFILRRNTTEAERVLRQSYDCFAEGFDTPDLVEAKTILDELR